MKVEVDGQIMKEFFGLRERTYSSLKYSNDKDKKRKRHNKVSHKKNLNFKIIKTVCKQFKLKIK